MSETIKKDRDNMRAHADRVGDPWLRKLVNDADRLADHEQARTALEEELAQTKAELREYQKNTIQRDESVPDFARSWAKEPRGHCWWFGDRNRRIADVLVEPAPDLRPDTEGPITLPIVEV